MSKLKVDFCNKKSVTKIDICFLVVYNQFSGLKYFEYLEKGALLWI